MLLFDCFPAVNSLQNRFVQIHNDAREENHFAPAKCKKYTEKIFLAFCGDLRYNGFGQIRPELRRFESDSDTAARRV